MKTYAQIILALIFITVELSNCLTEQTETSTQISATTTVSAISSQSENSKSATVAVTSSQIQGSKTTISTATTEKKNEPTNNKKPANDKINLKLQDQKSKKLNPSDIKKLSSENWDSAPSSESKHQKLDDIKKKFNMKSKDSQGKIQLEKSKHKSVDNKKSDNGNTFDLLSLGSKIQGDIMSGVSSGISGIGSGIQTVSKTISGIGSKVVDFGGSLFSGNKKSGEKSDPASKSKSGASKSVAIPDSNTEDSNMFNGMLSGIGGFIPGLGGKNQGKSGKEDKKSGNQKTGDKSDSRSGNFGTFGDLSGLIPRMGGNQGSGKDDKKSGNQKSVDKADFNSQKSDFMDSLMPGFLPKIGGNQGPVKDDKISGTQKSVDSNNQNSDFLGGLVPGLGGLLPKIGGNQGPTSDLIKSGSQNSETKPGEGTKPGLFGGSLPGLGGLIPALGTANQKMDDMLSELRPESIAQKVDSIQPLKNVKKLSDSFFANMRG